MRNGREFHRTRERKEEREKKKEGEKKREERWDEGERELKRSNAVTTAKCGEGGRIFITEQKFHSRRAKESKRERVISLSFSFFFYLFILLFLYIFSQREK